MRQVCEICSTPYSRGDFIDTGVGYMQISADEPSCDCEYEYVILGNKSDDVLDYEDEEDD